MNRDSAERALWFEVWPVACRKPGILRSPGYSAMVHASKMILEAIMKVAPDVLTDDLAEKWDESYQRFENTLFFPSEGVIRFVNKHIRRRTGIDSYTHAFGAPPEVLEIGSGAGRHLVFLAKAGFRPTGVELSAVACEQARALLAYEDVKADACDILNISATDLPFEDDRFPYAVSSATLDSMPTTTARAVIAEVHRAVRPGGLFFVDLIADDALRLGAVDADGDQIVTETHESGTIQSYFNTDKITDLFTGFNIRDIYKMQMTTVDNEIRNSRFYATLEKRDGG